MSSVPRFVPTLLAALFILAACAGAPSTTPPQRSATPPAEPLGPAPSAAAQPVAASITLIRSPSCGCCGGHAEHLARAGYGVSSVLTDAYTTVKDSHAIPTEMRSCHTSLVSQYFVEGHVPVAAIEQLLREMPEIDGIALPGMPPGSPGMDGVAQQPLVIWAINDGQVVGEFGRFEAPFE
jgi:hypothetical protein